MNKSILKVVGVVAVATALCVGCGDKSDDGPDDGGSPSDSTITPPDTTRPPQANGVVGDWLFVSDEEGYGTIWRWMTAFSFKSAGQFALREWENFGDFWIEEFFESDDRCQLTWGTSGDKIYWGEECDGNEFYGDTSTYRISGDTLKINYDDEWHLLLRVNLETFKKSLGKVYSLNHTLCGYWYRNGDEHIDFQHSSFEASNSIYIDTYRCDTTTFDDNHTSISCKGDVHWYTEDTRLFLFEWNCDDEYENCVVAKTITLDYQLTNGNKTLRLRPTGSNAVWDVWTQYDDDDYMYKARSKSEKGKYAIIPFLKYFGGRF